MIELIRELPENVLAAKAVGKVTAEDYETVLIPEVETRLKDHNKLSLLYVLGDEFAGFEAGAMWEDTKVGLMHLTAWERIAVVSDSQWVRGAVKAFGFLMPCEVKVFTTGELAAAKAWVSERVAC